MAFDAGLRVECSADIRLRGTEHTVEGRLLGLDNPGKTQQNTGTQ
jgi:hypothetical protein